MTALATMYVSWNCNQTFITEKLNAYSRSSSTRREGPSLASKSVEEIVFSVLLLLRASYKKISGVFIAFTHIWLWSQTGDWRYEYENTNTSYTLISWWCCGGPFSIYTSDFPDPDLSRAELNNITYLNTSHFGVDGLLSLQYLCPSHRLWPGASNTIKQRAEPPGTTPSTSPSHLLTCCYQPLAALSRALERSTLLRAILGGPFTDWKHLI